MPRDRGRSTPLPPAGRSAPGPPSAPAVQGAASSQPTPVRDAGPDRWRVAPVGAGATEGALRPAASMPQPPPASPCDPRPQPPAGLGLGPWRGSPPAAGPAESATDRNLAAMARSRASSSGAVYGRLAVSWADHTIPADPPLKRHDQMIPAPARSPVPAAMLCPSLDPSQAPRSVAGVQPVARTPSVDSIASAARPRGARGRPREPSRRRRSDPTLPTKAATAAAAAASLVPPASIARQRPSRRPAAQHPGGDRAARSAPAQVRIGTIDVTVVPPPPTPTAPAPVAPAALTGGAATTPLSGPIAAWYGLAQR